MEIALVLNAGSSTLKWSALAVRGSEQPLATGTVEWRSDAAMGQAEQMRSVFRDAVSSLPSTPVAVGHRVVHGGARFRSAVRITPEVRAALDDLVEVDPLHTPAALAGIDAVSAEAPGLPQVAAFDTSFHVTLPPAAAAYPLPREWSERLGLRRFGFHGLSVSYAVGRIAAMMGAVPRRLLVCHLGSGCSLTAVVDGRSLDTTMGFTPLDGVMMATRPGALDPGLLLHLQRRGGIDLDALEQGLQHGSGLAGMSGVGADLRHVLAAADGGDAAAALAYETFLHSLVRMSGAMIAVLGGLDALVLTGGIGEHSERVRTDLLARLAYAGVPSPANPPTPPGAPLPTGTSPSAAPAGPPPQPADPSPDRELSPPGAAVRVFVIAAREDLAVLRAVESVLQL
jgi:acetate kinase